MRRGRLFLIDWDADGAPARAETLGSDGWTVDFESLDGAKAVKHMRERPPDVVAVDLSRLPSHGRETARAVRAVKELRDVPIVFYGGSDDARAKAAGLVPGAVFTTVDELPHVLARSAFRPAGG